MAPDKRRRFAADKCRSLRLRRTAECLRHSDNRRGLRPGPQV